jgi:hypothetical protein
MVFTPILKRSFPRVPVLQLSQRDRFGYAL